MAARTAKFLNREEGLLFRITHISNVPWILDHGLHCPNSPTQDPGFRAIGNPDLIGKRRQRVVPAGPGGTLNDYVPFYFTPYSPMLYNLKTGYGGVARVPMAQIVILVTSVPRLVESGLPFVLTDRHAYLSTAVFSPDASGLDQVDWGILQAKDFTRSDDDPGRIERYQAEGLVHGCVSFGVLRGLACHGDAQQALVQDELTRRQLPLPVAVKPDWYF